MPMIARVMDLAETEFSELDRIAVTTGPGSFTGLRVGIAAARGIALAAGKPAIGLSTLAGFAAQHIAEDDSTNVVAAIDARHEHVYLQIFGVGGRTVVAPRIAPLREAVRAAATAPARMVGSAADLIVAAWPKSTSPAAAGRAARGARHRLDRAARRRRGRRLRPAQAALSARARRAAAGRGTPAAPMIAFIANLFARGEATLSEASVRDAAAIARLHGASFHRGWSDGEIEADAARPPCARAPRDRRTQPAADSSCRGWSPARRKSSRSRSRRRSAARAWRGGCSTCICAASPDLARARSSSRSTRATRRRSSSIAAPDFARSGAGRAITRATRDAAALVLRRDLV